MNNPFGSPATASQQEQQLLRAIAVSSTYIPGAQTSADRQAAFEILEDFKQRFDQRVPIALSWLHRERITYDGQHDITLATQLLALEVISSFLGKGYSGLNPNDRMALRQGLLKAARMVAASPIDQGSRILANKLSLILEGLLVRDFPQRWETFTVDMFSSCGNGGLWYDEPGPQAAGHLGVRIALECLKLTAEDCTDADFNTKISTQRRSDVLVGLNEVAAQSFMPLLFQALEHYPILQSSKANLFNMHSFLLQGNRTCSTMTPEESSVYNATAKQREDAADLIASTLATLEKFCASMPVKWILGETSGASGGASNDFVTAFLHLLRERDARIQIHAADCLEQLCFRGRLEFSDWMSIVRELPAAVREANATFDAEFEQIRAEEAAVNGNTQPPDRLTIQLEFHRTLSRVLSVIVASNVSYITTSKRILTKKAGSEYEQLMAYLKLLVELLHHPSGRIAIEQIGMWVALLRDPQIVKAKILDDCLEDLIICYMNQVVRIRMEDVENGTHPQSQVLEASFDDEDDYDAWMSDIRSRSSMLFKLIGNVVPYKAADVFNKRIQSMLATHGSGQPLNFTDANGRLTQKSDAVILFEGMFHPLDNALSGIPSWALDGNLRQADKQRAEIRSSTCSSLSEMARGLSAWDPPFLWLKFRRAQLLEALKYYWVYDPSTLLQAVDSLLRNMGISEQSTSNPGGRCNKEMESEIIGLKKKSGVSLVVIAKKVPQHLVPWLSQLSGATRNLLSSEGLIPMNQMHLFEFLTCVVNAVEDPSVRANFIAEVMANAVQTLESAEIMNSVASAPALLDAFGVTLAKSQPGSVTNIDNVQTVSRNYNRHFTALNRLLAVGRRCNEAARKKLLAGTVAAPNAAVSPGQLNFPDEGPVSIQTLALRDPFAPLWPRILPHIIQVYETTLSVWRAEHQIPLLQNPLQRYVYAISDDEAYLAKTQDNKSGGVFGHGGTAGSVVAGADRRDRNLVPKWSGWFNELRNCCFQMIGLLAASRVLFAPEIASMYPRFVAVVTDPLNLKSMEHRHFTQFLKHVVEMLLTSCPAPLYATHLAPIMSPVLGHLRVRLEKSWQPILSGSTSASDVTKPLTSSNAAHASAWLAKGEDAWFTWYYAHAGLFVGDLDAVTAESAVEKYRVEFGRCFSDVLQVALALKGDWALVLANQAKEEQAKKTDSTKLTAGPSNKLTDEGVAVNADGTPKAADQASIDARKLLRINRLCHFLLLENEKIAGDVTILVIQCLQYPDAYISRRLAKVCHRVLETVAWAPQYSQLLGQHLFTQLVKNVVTEPKWMVGLEWDTINVIRDIYCRLVLGQTLQVGGQGAGQQQNPAVGNVPGMYEQAKTWDRPLSGGGILTQASPLPRQFLESLPGIQPGMVDQLHADMKRKRSAKDQKDFIRDFLRVVSDNLGDHCINGGTPSAAGGLLDRAVGEESMLHHKRRSHEVPALPEKLVTHSQVNKMNQKRNKEEPEGLSAFRL